MRLGRGRQVVLVGLVALGCGDKQVSDSGNPFGGTAATSSSVTDDGTAPDTETGSTGAGSGQATTGPTTTTPATDGGSSSGTPTTGAPTTGTPSDSSGNPGDGQLGGCIGTGAWQSCAQYCEANLELCVPGGCGGATVVYYNDVADCEAMDASGEEAIACDEGFAMGGGISFARCCCT